MSEKDKKMTTTSQRSQSKTKEKSDVKASAKKKKIDVQNVEEEADEDAQVEVTLNNCLEIDTFLHQSRLMKIFYQTTQKLEGMGDETDRKVQQLNFLKENKKQLFGRMRKKEETIYKLKKDLA